MIICNPRQLSPSAGFVLSLLSSPPSSLHLCSNSVPTSGFLGFLPGLPWVNDAQLTGHPVRMPRLRISICQDRERAGPPLHGCSCTWGAGPSLRSAGAHTHSHHQTHSDNYIHTSNTHIHTFTGSLTHIYTLTHCTHRVLGERATATHHPCPRYSCQRWAHTCEPTFPPCWIISCL